MHRPSSGQRIGQWFREIGFIPVFASDQLGNPEGTEVTFSAFPPHTCKMGITTLISFAKLDPLVKQHREELSVTNSTSLKRLQPCLRRWSDKKLSWQFPQALNGKKEWQLITPSLSMMSFKQMTTIHFSPLPPFPPNKGGTAHRKEGGRSRHGKAACNLQTTSSANHKGQK